jgi:hypothetical protein
MSEAIIAIVSAEVLPRKEKEFEALTRKLFALVGRKGYGTDGLIHSTKQPNLYFDLRDWTSAQAAERAHADPEIHAQWAKLDEVCKIAHVVGAATEVMRSPRGREVKMSRGGKIGGRK